VLNQPQQVMSQSTSSQAAGVWVAASFAFVVSVKAVTVPGCGCAGLCLLWSLVECVAAATPVAHA
jgi:hypothetical protein